MKTYKELRDIQYEFQTQDILALGIDINNFWKNPYTFFKIRVAIELSVPLVYFLQRTRITPNMVTIIYALSGVFAGILLASQNKYAITFGLTIFFFRIVLDATDGQLARTTGKTSLTGKILDPYAAHLGDLGFQIGLGFYVASYNNIFFYFIPLIPFFYAAKLKGFSEALIFRLLVDQELKLITNDSSEKKDVSSQDKYAGLGKYKKLYYTLNSFLDDRARTVDTISLVVILELFFSLPKVTWIIFFLMVFKSFILFSINFFVIARGGWIESRVKTIPLE